MAINDDDDNDTNDDDDGDDSPESYAPAYAITTPCFAVRQCSHCHHQSLVMMLMTMITMMILTIMIFHDDDDDDDDEQHSRSLFWSCCHPMLNFSKNSNLDKCMRYFETLMQQ